MRFVRKNAPLPTVEILQTEAAELKSRIAASVAEVAYIDGEMPNMIGDPAQRREAEDRRAALEAQIGTDRRTLALIEEAIPAAKRRDKRAAVEADKAEQERRTNKLCRSLEARYTAAAEAFAAVLHDIKADANAWEALNYRARELGVPTGVSAEERLRQRFATPIGNYNTSGGFTSLWRKVIVLAWDGSRLFDSTPRGMTL
jgi:hypothetical protein